MDQLAENDGFSTWRQGEARDLTSAVQSAITRSQTPANCSQAKKLVCPLNYECGLGCQMHIAVYCLITALATSRVMIISDQTWQNRDIALKQFFMPVTQCTDYQGRTTLNCWLTSHFRFLGPTKKVLQGWCCYSIL